MAYDKEIVFISIETTSFVIFGAFYQKIAVK
jgi:hypothetical protein